MQANLPKFTNEIIIQCKKAIVIFLSAFMMSILFFGAVQANAQTVEAGAGAAENIREFTLGDKSFKISDGKESDTIYVWTHGPTLDSVELSKDTNIWINSDPNTEMTQTYIEINTTHDVNITLNGVNINRSWQNEDKVDNIPAFNISENAGTVNLYLADGSNNILTSGYNCAGLQKGRTSQLNIYGNTGRLEATGGRNGAGIGSGYNGSGITTKNITINGGIITANAGQLSAGIGGGCCGGGNNIKINGGTVTARGKYGAGIGGGYSYNWSYECSDINITGGKVKAFGGVFAAGIGGGRLGSAKNINISGGEVEAESIDYGAGIGGGCEGNASNINITGGKVTATGETGGAGIGGGSGGSGLDITISSGTVTAQGGSKAAGIGGGYKDGIENGGHGTNITIKGGKVTATGGSYAAGIGGGKDGVGSDIKISNGEVFAYGGENAAGIEGSPITISGGTITATGGTAGDGIYGHTSYDPITIEGGTVIATGGENGSGIKTSVIKITDGKVTTKGNGSGSGINIYGNLIQGSEITISGGEVTAEGGTSGDGIGGSGPNINISGGVVNATGGQNGVGIGNHDQNKKSSITISDGIIIAKGGECAAGIGGANNVGYKNIEITGGDITATGGNFAAGIGGGAGGFASTINISGGKITATGGSNGAGIGTGQGSNMRPLYCQGLNITGGEVTATGGESAAGIGGGRSGNGSKITISSGKVTATGGSNGAGIGGGENGAGYEIKVTDGEVTATGGEFGAGIGTGGGTYGSGYDITISGGTVIATAGSDADGIGGKKDKAGTNIIIDGGNVKTTFLYGQPINSNSDAVYQTSLTVPVTNELNTTITGSTYVTEGIKAIDTNKVYFYLPANSDDTMTEIICNGIHFKTQVKEDGENEFLATPPELSELSVPGVANAGEKISLTAPGIVNNINNFSIISQGWEISKAGDEGFTVFDTLKVLEPSYNKAKLRYFVEYNDTISNKKVYSNEVEITVNKYIANVTITNDITKAYDGKEVSDITYETKSKGQVTVMYKLANADNSTYLESKPSALGNYKAKVIVAEDENYQECFNEKEFSIKYLEAPQDPFTLSKPADTDIWYNDKIIVTPKEGFTISDTFEGTYSNEVTITESQENFIIYLKNSSDEMTDGIKVGSFKIDTTAPEVEIKVEENNIFKELLNTITFELFFKESPTVTITSTDDESRVDKIYYYVSEDRVLAEEELKSITWEEYNDDKKPEILANKNYIVYAYAIDKAGNKSNIINTNGFVFDNLVPTVSNIEEGGRYSAEKTFTVTDTSGSKVTVEINDGAETKPIAPNVSGQYTLEGYEGDITIIATDEAGNKIEVNVYVKPKSEVRITNDISKTFDGAEVSDVEFDADSESEDYTVLYKLADADDNSYTENKPSKVGNYKVKVIVAEDENYGTGYVEKEFSIKYLPIPTEKSEITYPTQIKDNWYTEAVIVTPPEGYLISDTIEPPVTKARMLFRMFRISSYNNIQSLFKEELKITENKKNYQVYYMNKETGQITEPYLLGDFSVDTIAPSVKIKIGENEFSELENEITFDYFFNKKQTIEITAEDQDSGVDKIYYYISEDRGLEAQELQDITWTEYNNESKPELSPNKNYIVYAYAVDKAGHESEIISTNGLVFDDVAPVNSGIENGKAYKPNTEVSVSDETEVKVTINGKEVEVKDGKFTLEGYEGKLEIKSIDQAGNETVFEIFVNEEGLIIEEIKHENGSTTVNKTNNNGDLVESTVTKSDGSTVKTEYNEDGSIIKTKKNALGKTTEITIKNDDGSTIKTKYKEDGSKVETKKDSLGNITQTIVTNEDGSSVKIEYKEDGSVIETKFDESGNVIETIVKKADDSNDVDAYNQNGTNPIDDDSSDENIAEISSINVDAAKTGDNNGLLILLLLGISLLGFIVSVTILIKAKKRREN